MVHKKKTWRWIAPCVWHIPRRKQSFAEFAAHNKWQHIVHMCREDDCEEQKQHRNLSSPVLLAMPMITLGYSFKEDIMDPTLHFTGKKLESPTSRGDSAHPPLGTRKHLKNRTHSLYLASFIIYNCCLGEIKNIGSRKNQRTLYSRIQRDMTDSRASAYTVKRQNTSITFFFYSRQNILTEYLWGPKRDVVISQSFALGMMQCSFELW